MPLITPAYVDLPLDYVTRAWYTEATNNVGAGTLLSITATIPADAAVWQMFSVDIRRESSIATGRVALHLAAAGQSTPPVEVRAMLYRHRRTQFLQHLWTGLPAGTHTFSAHMATQVAGGRAESRMMTLLLLKR